ncbi:MAG: hypothetical protein ABJ205_08005 [Erythrobacter sp.]|uniref:hypothetical protein n=1 Tax=Erythrobacter sp. TaxID=1042 RepID=UPI003267A065
MATQLTPVRFLACLSLLVVTACAPADEGVDEAQASGGDNSTGDAPQAEPMLMADTGWLSVGSDGSVQTTFLDTGGRYRDFRNGTALDTGDWEQRPDGSLCFTPDGGQGGCWTPDTPGEDGSIIVTSTDGKRVEIKRITYTPPPVEKVTEANN